MSIKALGRGFLQGGSGQLADEVSGATGALVHGAAGELYDPNTGLPLDENALERLRRAYEEQVATHRRDNDAADEESPWAYGVGELAGGVLSPANKLQWQRYPDAVAGALEGFGGGDGLLESAGLAALGGVAGFVGGKVGRRVSDYVGRGAKALRRKAAGLGELGGDDIALRYLPDIDGASPIVQTGDEFAEGLRRGYKRDPKLKATIEKVNEGVGGTAGYTSPRSAKPDALNTRVDHTGTRGKFNADLDRGVANDAANFEAGQWPAYESTTRGLQNTAQQNADTRWYLLTNGNTDRPHAEMAALRDAYNASPEAEALAAAKKRVEGLPEAAEDILARGRAAEDAWRAVSDPAYTRARNHALSNQYRGATGRISGFDPNPATKNALGHASPGPVPNDESLVRMGNVYDKSRTYLDASTGNFGPSDFMEWLSRSRGIRRPGVPAATQTDDAWNTLRAKFEEP